MVTGSSRSFSFANYEMVYVLKVDADGSIVWQQYFGDGGNLQARDIVENPDGTFLLTGITTFEGTGTGIAKLDASGNLLWNDDIGLGAASTSIIRDAHGKYVVTGFAWDTLIAGAPDVLLMRVTER